MLLLCSINPFQANIPIFSGQFSIPPENVRKPLERWPEMV